MGRCESMGKVIRPRDTGSDNVEGPSVEPTPGDTDMGRRKRQRHSHRVGPLNLTGLDRFRPILLLARAAPDRPAAENRP